VQVDEAITVLFALKPLGIKAALAAAERLEASHDGALAQWRLAVDRASRGDDFYRSRAHGGSAAVSLRLDSKQLRRARKGDQMHRQQLPAVLGFR
jgi:hypothetical protein